MKIKIKLMVTFMALVLSIFIAISVSAASEDPYQAVIDKLNKEYSFYELGRILRIFNGETAKDRYYTRGIRKEFEGTNY